MKFKDVVTFFFRKAENRELSNFAEIPVTIRGSTYPTGEHCFHAGKLLHAASRASDARRATELRERATSFQTHGSVAPDGLSAKRAGGRGKNGIPLAPEELEGWLEAAEALQREICLHKSGRPEVHACLARSGDAYILHQDNRAVADTPWGGKVKDLAKLLKAGGGIGIKDVVGENRLGHIWMDIRNGIPNSRR
jgi:predicted NAD-dependent protein-ADP-ribosyltransferase YbiA (DUF1768 family)